MSWGRIRLGAVEEGARVPCLAEWHALGLGAGYGNSLLPLHAVRNRRGSRTPPLAKHCPCLTLAAAAGPSPGCAGFVLVKKVPGTLHFVARAPGHSFDYLNMNLSHNVHYFFFGNRPGPK
jgi:hypothetical protein